MSEEAPPESTARKSKSVVMNVAPSVEDADSSIASFWAAAGSNDREVFRHHAFLDSLKFAKLDEFTSLIESPDITDRRGARERMSETHVAFEGGWGLFLAALASMIGFRNFTVFTVMAVQWNGGVFLISYLWLLVGTSIPFIQASMCTGQSFRNGLSGVSESISPRARGMPLVACLSAFFYLVVNQREVNNLLQYFFNSLRSDVPWVPDQETKDLCRGFDDQRMCEMVNYCIWVPNEEEAWDCDASHLYAALKFYEVQFASPENVEFQLKQVWMSLGTWTVIAIFSSAGPKFFPSYSWIAMFVMVVMFILVFLSFDAIDLNEQNVFRYMFHIEWRHLLNSDMWLACFDSMILGLTFGFGLHEALGSNMKIGTNAMVPAQAAPLVDMAASMLIAVVGFLCVHQVAAMEGTTAEEIINSQVAYSLVYVLFPTALSHHPANQMTCASYFLTAVVVMMTTGIVTLEAIITPITSAGMSRKWRRRWVVWSVCSLAFLCSTPFFFTFSHSLRSWFEDLVKILAVYLAFCQCLFYAWSYAPIETGRSIGPAASLLNIWTWISLWVVLALLAVVRGATGALSSDSVIVGIILFILYFIGLSVTLIVASLFEKVVRSTQDRIRDGWWWAITGPVDLLRHDLNGACVGGGRSRLQVSWCMLVKYVTPMVMGYTLVRCMVGLAAKGIPDICPWLQWTMIGYSIFVAVLVPIAALGSWRTFAWASPPQDTVIEPAHLPRKPEGEFLETSIHYLHHRLLELHRSVADEVMDTTSTKTGSSKSRRRQTE